MLGYYHLKLCCSWIYWNKVVLDNTAPNYIVNGLQTHRGFESTRLSETHPQWAQEDCGWVPAGAADMQCATCDHVSPVAYGPMVLLHIMMKPTQLFQLGCVEETLLVDYETARDSVPRRQLIPDTSLCPHTLFWGFGSEWVCFTQLPDILPASKEGGPSFPLGHRNGPTNMSRPQNSAWLSLPSTPNNCLRTVKYLLCSHRVTRQQYYHHLQVL